VACTLDILGDRWTLLLVRDMLLGNDRYDQFLRAPEGIATNVLADRLARLIESGIVETRRDPLHRGRATYHLTERGAGLQDVIEAVARWGLKNLRATKLDPRAPGGFRKTKNAKPPATAR
jgi:DNA-binding HxlR family transcriptional regulator